MRFCTNCGKEIKFDASFCPYCGAVQNVASTVGPEFSAKAPSMAIHNQNKFLAILLGGIGAVVVIALGVLGYHNYHINHLTEQDIANVGAKVSQKYLADQVSVSYNEEKNVFTLTAKSKSTLLKTSEGVISGSKSDSAMNKYVTDLKDISKGLENKIPKKDQNYSIELLNPYNTDKILYRVKGSSLVFNFVTDDDSKDTSAAYAHMDADSESALRKRIDEKYDKMYGNDQ